MGIRTRDLLIQAKGTNQPGYGVDVERERGHSLLNWSIAELRAMADDPGRRRTRRLAANQDEGEGVGVATRRAEPDGGGLGAGEPPEMHRR
jgi:hypothetical protein